MHEDDDDVIPIDGSGSRQKLVEAGVTGASGLAQQVSRGQFTGWALAAVLIVALICGTTLFLALSDRPRFSDDDNCDLHTAMLLGHLRDIEVITPNELPSDLQLCLIFEDRRNDD